MTEGAGALTGLVVVDLSATLASAYTSLFFADLGAEVIQIEPRGGSRLRHERAWPFWLRGKKSIVLDYDDPADRQVAFRLAADADIVIEAFRPGVTDRLGLGYEALSADNPGLVYTSITGFGPTGSMASVKGYEAVVWAKIGSMYGPNRSGRRGPVMMNTPGATISAGFLAIQGTLTALHERLQSGHGQRVDTSLFQGMLAQDPWSYFGPVLAKLFPDAFSGVGAPPSADRPMPTTWLTFGLLNAYSKDGRWMQFAHATPQQYQAFVEELGLGWALEDPKWKDAANHEDPAVRERWWDMMLEAARSKTIAEWQEVFDRNNKTFAEVYRHPDELFEHPQFVHDGNIAEFEVEGLGSVTMLGPLVKMSGTPGDPSVPPARIGEHDAELRARPRRVIERPTGEATNQPPLQGLTILDLGTFFAGPFGSTMLTDSGARVIKIEPVDGDPFRFNMPIPEWCSVRVTQGKESLALDAYSDEGRAILAELIRRSDIVLHTYRGGVAERMGVDAKAALELNPDLIYHHGQGYGVTGPYSRRQAYAPTIAAGSGFARRSGGGGPEGVALTLEEIKAQAGFLAGAQPGLADGFAAMGVGAGLALAVVARDLGRGGQTSMTTMLSTMGHVMGDAVIEYPGMPSPRTTDEQLLGFGALYHLYEASDRWVVLCITTDDEWKALVTAVPESGLGEDRRFATATERGAHDAALAEALAAMFATRTAAEWESTLMAADVACVSVEDNLGAYAIGMHIDGRLADQLGMTAHVEHPLFGTVPRTRRLFTLSRSGEALGASCTIGQHTDGVLGELGYTEEQIADLRARNIVA